MVECVLLWWFAVTWLSRRAGIGPRWMRTQSSAAFWRFEGAVLVAFGALWTLLSGSAF